MLFSLGSGSTRSLELPTAQNALPDRQEAQFLILFTSCLGIVSHSHYLDICRAQSLASAAFGAPSDCFGNLREFTVLPLGMRAA